MSESDSRAPVPATAPTAKADQCATWFSNMGRIVPQLRCELESGHSGPHEARSRNSVLHRWADNRSDAGQWSPPSAPSPGAEDGERTTASERRIRVKALARRFAVYAFDMVGGYTAISQRKKRICDDAGEWAERIVEERMAAAVPAPGEERTGTADEPDVEPDCAFCGQPIRLEQFFVRTPTGRYAHRCCWPVADKTVGGGCVFCGSGNIVKRGAGHFPWIECRACGATWETSTLASSAASAPAGEPTAGGTTTAVTRFGLARRGYDDPQLEMQSDGEGEYVLHSDYAALSARLSKLTDVLQEDVADLLRAAGLPDHARAESPHAILQADVKQRILELREVNQELEAELLATSEALGEGPYSSISEHARALSARLAAAEAENIDLRKLLWYHHGCPQQTLYGDDGELQCSNCLIDFKRLPATEIARTFIERSLDALRLSGAARTEDKNDG